MSMLLSHQPEHFEEYEQNAHTTQSRAASKLRKVWGLIIVFSPILWVLFFLFLTALAGG